jgi:hypothetical protein
MACLAEAMRTQTKQHCTAAVLKYSIPVSQVPIRLKLEKHCCDASSGSQIAVPHGRRCATSGGNPELPE